MGHTRLWHFPTFSDAFESMSLTERCLLAQIQTNSRFLDPNRIHYHWVTQSGSSEEPLIIELLVQD